MPRTFSKRRSRFSSLWGLDTTSKRKTKGHPSINQVSVSLTLQFLVFEVVKMQYIKSKREVMYFLFGMLTQAFY